MPRSLHLVLHLGRKVCVRSVNKDAEIDLPPFFRDDEIQLAFTLVQDADEPTAEAPFEAVDTTGWDLRVAIGNGLSGTARRILAQTLSFQRDTDGGYQGELSLRTLECADYLQLPDQYAGQASYDIGQETYFEGLTYRRVAAASASVPEGSPATSPSLWSSYDLYRDPLYFEVVLVRPEGMETVVQMLCSVVERVIQQPPVSPTLIEDLDALADAMASRLAASSSIQWEHNRDANDPDGNPAAPYDPAVAVPYLGRVYDKVSRRYYQALREIKHSVGLKAVGDLTIGHLPGFIDGAIATAQERLALFEQSNGSENGIYTVEGVGPDLKPDGARFTTANPDGRGRHTITPTGNKLYYVEISGGETVTCFNQGLTESGTLQADPGRVITIYGVYGALIQTVVRAAGAVRASDWIRAEDRVAGTVLVVTRGSANAGKRFNLVQSGSTELLELWEELTGAAGPFAVTEPAFFAETAPSYSSPAYDPDISYSEGSQVVWEGWTFVAHTPSSGQVPTKRRFWGQLLEFAPGAHLVASVRLKAAGGLKVGPQGVEVDFDAIANDTFEVANEAEMLGLPAKPGDYAIRSDQLGRPYRLKASPATELGNWVSLDAERIEAGANIPTQSRYRSTGVAHITTQAPHGLFTGNEVTIRNLGGDGYNLTGIPVTVTAEDAFNYESPGDDEVPSVVDQGGYVVKLIPVVTRPVTLTTQTPAFLPVASLGSPGTGQRAAREDHVHPMPGLATEESSGFMSPAHFALLEGLGGSSGPEVGFDLPVQCLLVDAGKVWVGGQFTRYGTHSRNRIALLDNRGRADATFDPQTGFTQPVIRLAKAGDGSVVAGSALLNNYRGLAGGQVWKLSGEGAAWPGWNCPVPLATSGENTLVGLATAGSAVIAITPYTLRILSAVGADLVNATSNAPLHDVLGYESKFFLSGAAFTAARGDAIVNGLIHPRALKLIGVEPTAECPCLAGTNVASFSAGAGEGANAAIHRLVVFRSYDGNFVIGGTPRDPTDEGGLDHSWNGGNAIRFQGLYKIGLDGLADDSFEVDLALSEEGVAIPFAADSLGRIYLGGPVRGINGTATTPWRLYRITANGEFDREFAGFNDKVLCAALLDDNNIVVGGVFTRYGARPAGRITYLNAAGDVVLPDAGQPVGRVVTRTQLPDIGLDPRAQYDLVRLLPATSAQVVSLWIHDPYLGWMDICGVCRIQGDTLPAVAFEPPSGTTIGAGISVALRVAGFLNATIRYTLDGSTPTLSSPTYSTPIAISAPTTVKAFASLPGGRADGPLSVAQYDVAPIEVLSPPSFSPSSGEPPVTVTILPPSGHPDAAMRYTLDGSPATEISTPYEGPFSVTTTTTLRAIAMKPGFQNSAEVAVTYQAASPPPAPAYYIERSVTSDVLHVQIPGGGTGPLTGAYIEVAMGRGTQNYGPWAPLTTVGATPTAQGSVLLRSNAAYLFGTTVWIRLRSRLSRNNATLFSAVAEFYYQGNFRPPVTSN